jgi:hypothetical protein
MDSMSISIDESASTSLDGFMLSMSGQAMAPDRSGARRPPRGFQKVALRHTVATVGASARSQSSNRPCNPRHPACVRLPLPKHDRRVMPPVRGGRQPATRRNPALDSGARRGKPRRIADPGTQPMTDEPAHAALKDRARAWFRAAA